MADKFEYIIDPMELIKINYYNCWKNIRTIIFDQLINKKLLEEGAATRMIRIFVTREEILERLVESGNNFGKKYPDIWDYIIRLLMKEIPTPYKACFDQKGVYIEIDLANLIRD